MENPYLVVIGVGYWGKNLVRNFSKLGVLHSICGANPELLKQCQAEHNVPKIFTDYKEALKDDFIRAVAVAAPAVGHYEIVKAALLVGCFVEKPFALNVRHQF